MSHVVHALVSALGPDQVLTGEEIPARNFQDASNRPPTPPLALVRPGSTPEVSTVLRICHEYAQPVVVQGGMTGLAGGAHPATGEIALSLERMVGIEEIDPASATLTALAGTTLVAVQEAAEAAGFCCGIDLGSRGSCTIGGNVATNAGGNQVLRYGSVRRNVLGLEAVLADGSVVSGLNKMIKNNTGYDWPQLMIGSEGTLGVVTRVVLGLPPRPASVSTVALALSSFGDTMQVLRFLQQTMPGRLLSFEVMWREFIAVAGLIGAASPFPIDTEIVALVEADTGLEDEDSGFDTKIATAIDAGWVKDAIVAQSKAQALKLWSLRETPARYRSHGYKVHGLDISLPLSLMAEAVTHLRAEFATKLRDLPTFWFGHAADSNIHVCALLKEADDRQTSVVDEIVYDCVVRFGGSISAEHGIGRNKKAHLRLSRSSDELELMRKLKIALDPQNILNPGRIL